MTESEAPKFRFTRRRVILAAAALGLALAVALGFRVFDGDSKGPVEATFVRFDRATNGYAARAILSLSNKTSKQVGSFSKDVLGVVDCRFLSQDPSGEVVWENHGCPGTGGGQIDLRSHLRREVTVTLPEDGRTGRVAVVLQLPIPPVWIIRTRALLGFKNPGWPEEKLIICDQEIQCPLVLPDGTVQPPRLVSGPERNR